MYMYQISQELSAKRTECEEKKDKAHACIKFVHACYLNNGTL